MTIASEANRSGPYACNGVTRNFPYEFRIYDAAHIRVVLTAPDGTESTLAPAAGYTVSGVGDSGGGAVEMAVAYAAGYRVTLVLDVPFTQDIDLENQGAYFAETIERAFDLQTQMSLQLKEQVARAVVLPVTSSVSVDRLTGAVLSLSDIQPQMLALVPIVDDIETVAGMADAVVAAEGHAGTAAAAAGVATSKAAEAAASAAAARTWDPALYSTTHEVETMLGAYVPAARKLKAGGGLSLDGVAGSDAEPAEGDLSGDRLLAVNLASKALAPELWNAGVDTTEAPISPAKLASAVGALGGSGTVKGTVEVSTSGNYTPSSGTTHIVAVLRGGGGGGGGTGGTSGATGGGEGGLGIALIAVDDSTSYIVVIGAGGNAGVQGGGGGSGGTTSITVKGVVYSATGGVGGPDATSSAGGGVPSATCLIGSIGGSSGVPTGGSSAWRQSGTFYGRGGNGRVVGSAGPGASAGGLGHMTIVELGS